MIEYDSRSWFSFLFTTKGSMFGKVFPGMVIMGLITLLICLLQFELEVFMIKAPLSIHSLLGVVLGLLLVFRTNTAYDRWWEARKELGNLVNTSRNIAIQLDGISTRLAKNHKQDLARILNAFVISLRDHLDEGVKMEKLTLTAKEMIDLTHAKHKPNYLLKLLNRKIRELHEDGVFDSNQMITFSTLTNELTNILGRCERILKTPIPIAYSFLLKRFVFVYVLSLPLATIHDFEYFSVPATMFIFYVMVTVELVGEEIENPFGHDDNDLPVDEICENICKNVNEILLDI